MEDKWEATIKKKIQWKQNIARLSPRCGSLYQSLSLRLPLLSFKRRSSFECVQTPKAQSRLSPWSNQRSERDLRKSQRTLWFNVLQVSSHLLKSYMLWKSLSPDLEHCPWLIHIHSPILANTVCGRNEGQLACPMTPRNTVADPHFVCGILACLLSAFSIF